MRAEPPVKRATVFVDGQNLFHAARAAFDRTYPDYDVHALGRAICASNGWAASEIRFYTGLPEASDNARWYRFWMAKLAAMGRQGVYVVSRPLRYRNQTVRLPDGTEHTVLVGEEKGIDVVDLRRTVDRDGPGDRPPGRIASWTIVTAGGVHDLAR